MSETVVRTPAKNIQVYNPTTNTLNVRWEPASGEVLQYRVVYAPLSGNRPSESVSSCRSRERTHRKYRRDTFERNGLFSIGPSAKMFVFLMSCNLILT